MNQRAVLFDLDGTLLDTLEDLCDSVNYALARAGYAQRSLEEVRQFVGSGVRNLIQRALPEGSDAPLVEEVLSCFRAHYNEHMDVKTHPYDGVLELLDALREQGFALGVVSNKYDGAVKRLCKKYFGERICVAVGETDGLRRKPSPDCVFAALAQMHAEPSQAVYIGDSDVDVSTAQNAALRMVAVTWGFRTKGQLEQAGATAFAATARELLERITEE